MDRFEQGLREEIGCQLASHKFTTFKNMYDAALAVEMRFKLNEGERSIGKKPRWMMGSNQAVGTRQQGNFQNANKRRGPINANGGKLKQFTNIRVPTAIPRTIPQPYPTITDSHVNPLKKLSESFSC
ncbi:hypothetical protein ACH5RR_009525 [Cinchona calisaya]|uniref:Uncharacterized protein n=1 Tax=Cinchona calisaya TaxID=153742 RepID=A0ABD3AF95_9GENT